MTITQPGYRILVNMALFTPTAFFSNQDTTPKPFDPTDLGIWSWLSMNEGSIGSSSNITNVTDLGSGGTAWNLGGGTGTSYAQRSTTSAITYNGGNAVIAKFDGTADFWRSQNFATITDGSGNTFIVMLCYVYNPQQKNDSIVSLSGTRDFQISTSNGSSWSGQFDMDGLSSTSTLSWYSDNGTTRNYTFQWNIYAFVFNKTGNQIYGRINGYSLSNTASHGGPAMTSGYVRVPCNRLGTRRLQMDMAEMMIVRSRPGTSTNTSIENLEKLEGWIAWTYGIEGRLNPSHSYANAAPKTGS